MKKATLWIADCGLRTGLRTGVAVVLAGVTLVAQARPQPGTKLPLDQVSAQMFHVSAGKRLKPASWPNGARVAVGLSFDVDNATADLATGNLISESISRGEYGAVDGVPRILRLLDKHQLPASFFIPAVSHLLHPDMIPMCYWILGSRVRIGPPGPDGRVDVEIRGHSVRALAGEIAGFGAGLEVVDPPELRELLARIGAEVAAVHAGPPA